MPLTIFTVFSVKSVKISGIAFVSRHQMSFTVVSANVNNVILM